MNLRFPKSFTLNLSPDRLVILVVVLGLAFVLTVLVPGLKLSGELVNTSAALKWVADQQRYPTIVRTSLETVRDRLTNRGYIQESADLLADASKKLDDAISAMTAARAGGWLSMSGLDSIAGKRAPALRDAWSKAQQYVVASPHLVQLVCTRGAGH